MHYSRAANTVAKRSTLCSLCLVLIECAISDNRRVLKVKEARVMSMHSNHSVSKKPNKYQFKSYDRVGKITHSMLALHGNLTTRKGISTPKPRQGLICAKCYRESCNCASAFYLCQLCNRSKGSGSKQNIDLGWQHECGEKSCGECGCVKQEPYFGENYKEENDVRDEQGKVKPTARCQEITDGVKEGKLAFDKKGNAFLSNKKFGCGERKEKSALFFLGKEVKWCNKSVTKLKETMSAVTETCRNFRHINDKLKLLLVRWALNSNDTMT